MGHKLNFPIKDMMPPIKRASDISLQNIKVNRAKIFQPKT